jgi:hypothetical protein
MEVIIWTNKRINLSLVEEVFQENPITKRLNEFSVEIRTGDRYDAQFFLSFSSSVVEARMRPQYHLIVLDSVLTENNSIATLINVFTCAMDQIKNHHMKFLTFFDLKTVPKPGNLPKMRYVVHAIQTLTDISPQTVRYKEYAGQPLSFGSNPEGGLTRLVLTILARSMVHQIRSDMNLK